jgi:hypothetical protein
MNLAQVKCLLVFSVFAVIGFGPVSPGCLIGMYSVMARPRWLLRVVRQVYENGGKPLYPAPPLEPGRSREVRIKCFLSLLTLFLIDIAPYPVTPSIAIPIILIRPRWFYELVERIYRD